MYTSTDQALLERIADAVDNQLARLEEVSEGSAVSGRTRDTAPKMEASARILSTLVFTDIVGSTRTASRMGDHEWLALRDRHDALSREQLRRFGGTEVKTTGDGFLAKFDAPARGIEWACAVRDVLRELNLETRAGVHTGECIWKDGQAEGIAVHIAARVLEQAGPNEVLVSRTVRDLVVGSGLSFAERPARPLKGLSGTWELFAVEEASRPS